MSRLANARGVSGAVATLRTRWVGEIVDMQAIDLNLLKRFLRPEDLQKALNAFVSSGGRELAGAKIYEKTESTIRG